MSSVAHAEQTVTAERFWETKLTKPNLKVGYNQGQWVKERCAMGWWKINSENRGQIDFDTDLNNGPLRNALPGSTPELYYNGDRPADTVGDACSRIEEILADSDIKLDAPQLRELLLEQDADEVIAFPDGVRIEVARILQEARCNVVDEYQKAWGRPPYDEEWNAVVNFVLGPRES